MQHYAISYHTKAVNAPVLTALLSLYDDALLITGSSPDLSFSSGVAAAAAALYGMEENRACVRRRQAVISLTGHFEVQRGSSSNLMTLR